MTRGASSENIVSKDYIDFVNSVTSDASKSQIDFVDALMIMEEQGAVPSRLLTAALGPVSYTHLRAHETR